MNVRDAITLAIDTTKELFGGDDHRLEEVEVKDGGTFEVTVSFRDSSRVGFQPYTFGPGGIASLTTARRAAIGVDASRTYKDVSIGSDGTVKSVRMRQIVVG